MERHKKRRLDVFSALLLLILIIHCLTILFLLYWAISTSLKYQGDYRNNLYGLPSGWPWEWEWSNYSAVIRYFYVPVTRNGIPQKIGMEYQLLYTMIYCVTGAFMSTAVPCCVAYLTAKFKFAFNKILVGIVVITMVLPIVGNSASTLQFLDFFGLYDNVWLNTVTQFNFLGIYFLVFRATFSGIPNDYREAAYLDGANDFTVFFRIMLPLVKKMFFTVLLLKFINYWEDYQTPLLYVPNYPTLAYGIYYLANYSSINEVNTVPARMAGCIIIAAPIILLYIVFREKLTGNLSMGGIKE